MIPDRSPIDPDFYETPEDEAYNGGRRDGQIELVDAIEKCMDDNHPLASLIEIAAIINDVRQNRF